MKIERTDAQELTTPGAGNGGSFSLDATDLAILALLQENCKRPLAEIGKRVGLSAPSVTERIHKLEAAGVIQAYCAVIDARALGRDITAFIGVEIEHPGAFDVFEKEVSQLTDVLECHHVTGQHTLMLKAKARNTEALEALIATLRSVDGVQRTETVVVLSTYLERSGVGIDLDRDALPKRGRRSPNKRDHAERGELPERVSGDEGGEA
jgi:Lrp/AsnC family leucine-responsive transcriptional regulator